MSPPRLIVVGGPNGCGKTTFARAYAAREGLAYLGADEIAARLSPDDPYAARIAAGRAFGQELTQAIGARRSIVVESTLSGGSFVRYVQAAKAGGYSVKLIFVFLNSPEHCVRRIAERVAQGGHDIPVVDVRRRYGRAITLFWKSYCPIADDWMLIDNGGEAFVRIASGRVGTLTIYNEDVWRQFLALVEKGEDEK